jgi:hypothetical protein
MRSSLINECRIVDVPQVMNRAGNIAIVQSNIDVPFSIDRVYYLYDTPCSETRGGHAHIALSQLIVAASGSFTISLDDGFCKKSVFLNNPSKGLFVVPGIWRDLHDFSSGSICLVLASHKFDSDDYIREYDKFLTYKRYDSSSI